MKQQVLSPRPGNTLHPAVLGAIRSGIGVASPSLIADKLASCMVTTKLAKRELQDCKVDSETKQAKIADLETKLKAKTDKLKDAKILVDDLKAKQATSESRKEATAPLIYLYVCICLHMFAYLCYICYFLLYIVIYCYILLFSII